MYFIDNETSQSVFNDTSLVDRTNILNLLLNNKVVRDTDGSVYSLHPTQSIFEVVDGELVVEVIKHTNDVTGILLTEEEFNDV